MADWRDESATFGDRLAFARERAGLSQAELAKRLGIKPASVRIWEADRAEPRATRLQMVAGLLGVSLRWLMSGEGEAPPGPAEHEGAERCLDELEAIRREQARLAERLARLERRLRAALA